MNFRPSFLKKDLKEAGLHLENAEAVRAAAQTIDDSSDRANKTIKHKSAWICFHWVQNKQKYTCAGETSSLRMSSGRREWNVNRAWSLMKRKNDAHPRLHTTSISCTDQPVVDDVGCVLPAILIQLSVGSQVLSQFQRQS